MSGSEILPSFCRSCGAFCPVLVTVEDGRAVKVTGDPEAIEYEGYTCPKGRSMPEQHQDARRLLTSLRRRRDGGFDPIDPLQAVDEIVGKLREIIDRHGLESVAFYSGTGVLGQCFGPPMAHSLFRAMGSPMLFTSATIDKPAEKITMALHGNWAAGAQSFLSSDVWMIIGGNPVIAKSNGAPYHNPGMRLKEAVRRGMKLIVIDPRKTETARRAAVHLQPRPGEDASILAGIIHIIIAENMHDRDFVEENALGFEALRDAVAPFTPEYVSERAGIPIEDLLAAARAFGQGKRGAAVCSTGPSFSPHSNVSFYLALCLNTLCGRWTRAGEVSPMPNVLLPAFTPRAQPQSPYPVFGKRELGVRGLRENASGLPTAGLAEMMLLEGDKRIRALISMGGNPMSSWPDERTTEAALKNLDLFVHIDVIMSATAKLADYVIATQMPLEVPATTYFAETTKYLGVTRGFEIPWGQYTPAIASPPPGSDLILEHEFMFRLAQKMGLQLDWINFHGQGKFLEAPTEVIKFDMDRIPTIDELWEITTKSARIPLDEVKKFPHGHAFYASLTVEPRAPDCTDMLQIGDPIMMAELKEIRQADHHAGLEDREFPYRLVSRRNNSSFNSVLVGLPSLAKKNAYNPTHMHPADMAQLGVKDGDVISLRSRKDVVLSIVESDDSLRPGVVSMSHGFGESGPGRGRNPHAGANVNLLVLTDEFDPISGIPRMSSIPVSIKVVPEGEIVALS